MISYGRNELTAAKLDQNVGIKMKNDRQSMQKHVIHSTAKLPLNFVNRNVGMDHKIFLDCSLDLSCKVRESRMSYRAKLAIFVSG